MPVNRNAYLQEQREEYIWTIVELFYRSLITFREQFEKYEWLVLQHSYRKGLDRQTLRLSAADLAGLLDFKAMETLRNDNIDPLKEACHIVYRDKTRTDPLDRFISDIFHEISILKEEHYNVKTYAPQYKKEDEEAEFSHIMDEAHVMFPKKLKHIRHLFRRARVRLEELMPTFVDCQILIRSLYLERDGWVKEAYEDGIRSFYRKMYPELRSIRGYYEAGMSFLESGFDDLALEAFRLAEKETSRVKIEDSKIIKKAEQLKVKIQELIEQLSSPSPGASSNLNAS